MNEITLKQEEDKIKKGLLIKKIGTENILKGNKKQTETEINKEKVENKEILENIIK